MAPIAAIEFENCGAVRMATLRELNCGESMIGLFPTVAVEGWRRVPSSPAASRVTSARAMCSGASRSGSCAPASAGGTRRTRCAKR